MSNGNIKWSEPLAGSVIGQSHVTSGDPCQDAFSIQTTDNGWISIVVCDGAGSALHGEEGAKVFSEKFSEKLISISHIIDDSAPGAWINDSIVEGILDIRNELRSKANVVDLRDYHCTLLAVLIGPNGGVAVHIGDGVIFGGVLNFKDDNTIILDSKYFVSNPENGEYLNETYFVTESIWTKHLRITPLPGLDWISLVTDGGAALCLDKNNYLNNHFIPSIFNEYSQNKFDINCLVPNELKKKKYERATSDDKTVVLVFKNEFTNYKNYKYVSSSSVGEDPVIFGEQKKTIKISPLKIDEEKEKPLEARTNEILQLDKLNHKKTGNRFFIWLLFIVLIITPTLWYVAKLRKWDTKLACSDSYVIYNEPSVKIKREWELTKLRVFERH